MNLLEQTNSVGELIKSANKGIEELAQTMRLVRIFLDSPRKIIEQQRKIINNFQKIQEVQKNTIKDLEERIELQAATIEQLREELEHKKLYSE